MAENKPAAPKVEEEAVQSVGVRDRVVMASRRSDGVTPAQSEDFEFIGSKEAAKAGARHQHVSAALADLEPVSTEGPFPTVGEQKKAVEAAEKRADAEVDKLHRGFGDDEA